MPWITKRKGIRCANSKTDVMCTAAMGGGQTRSVAWSVAEVEAPDT